MLQKFGESEKSSTFASLKQTGALVQLVRIHACHAWGRVFESRTHRKSLGAISRAFFIPLQYQHSFKLQGLFFKKTLTSQKIYIPLPMKNKTFKFI